MDENERTPTGYVYWNGELMHESERDYFKEKALNKRICNALNKFDPEPTGLVPWDGERFERYVWFKRGYLSCLEQEGGEV